MRRFPPLLLACLLALLGFAPTTQAAWDDMLKQIQEKAGGLLQDDASPGDGFDRDTLARALRDALEIGTERAVEQVSQPGGYLDNPAIRIPLPPMLQQAATLVRQYGGATLVDQFEQSMNRAAERAAPEASAYFIDALQHMSLEDARAIYEGPDDAATRYFERQTRESLTQQLRPLIRTAMNEVQVTRYYRQLVEQAERYPLAGNLDLNLENHVTDQAMDGLFQVLAEEERRIRQDPAARTTELLRDVFGR